MILCMESGGWWVLWDLGLGRELGDRERGLSRGLDRDTPPDMYSNGT